MMLEWRIEVTRFLRNLRDATLCAHFQMEMLCFRHFSAQNAEECRSKRTMRSRATTSWEVTATLTTCRWGYSVRCFHCRRHFFLMLSSGTLRGFGISAFNLLSKTCLSSLPCSRRHGAAYLLSESGVCVMRKHVRIESFESV